MNESFTEPTLLMAGTTGLTEMLRRLDVGGTFVTREDVRPECYARGGHVGIKVKTTKIGEDRIRVLRVE